jgi:hypothetical protein
MGEFLLLQWLQTRRGVIFCIVLLVWTATASICRLGSGRSVDPQQDTRVTGLRSADWHVSRETSQLHTEREQKLRRLGLSRSLSNQQTPACF